MGWVDGAGLVRCIGRGAGNDLEVVTLKTVLVFFRNATAVDFTVKMPRMSAAVFIDQYNLYDIIELENKRIAVHAIDEWVHDDILGS
jgi:hypothetical protein